MLPNTLNCFLVPRGCGPTCMAYLPNPPDHADERGQPWASCSLLVHAHRVSKHLTTVAHVLERHAERSHAQAADRARQTQLPPPTPK